jgi:hypothetical protein
MKTAVEWLEKQLQKEEYIEKIGCVTYIINQAKEMEEQQIIDACEKMYSEEEVRNIVEQTIEKFYKHIYSDKTKSEMKELWFEQFKKK